MKVALLSNVNVDYVIRALAGSFDVARPVGYGDVWGQLLNPSSSLNAENPDVIIFLPDIEQILDGSYDTKAVDEWFANFDAAMKREKEYYVSDVIFRSNIPADNDSTLEADICSYWLNSIKNRTASHVNVHILKVSSVISQRGKNSVFSEKLWYMGKIPYTNEGTRIIAGFIADTLNISARTPKKVLLLDLDNTLWGGVLGEAGVEGIALSDDHIGAVYRKVQQSVKAMGMAGVILAIVSKNNESDVQEVFSSHPHMILKREDFSAVKINWRDKADNIREISEELNLGLDSFVFIDDMAAERDNIKARVPAVTVPDFPANIEDYPAFIDDVFRKYFMKIRISDDDRAKTEQYAQNAKRKEAEKGLTYEEFLSSLKLQAERVKLDDAKLDRIAQMHGKTNQFNLTTKRYTRHDIERMLSEGFRIYAYNVRDKFGDYGLVAAALVDMKNCEIDSLLMSCRVMGKLVENYVIDDIENDLAGLGVKTLHAKYIKTAKNAPVEKLFDGLGYTVTAKNENETCYEIDLDRRPERKFFVNER